MKQRWKKIASLMLVTICAFSLTACGKKEETAAYQQITDDMVSNCAEVSQSAVESLAGFAFCGRRLSAGLFYIGFSGIYHHTFLFGLCGRYRTGRITVSVIAGQTIIIRIIDSVNTCHGTSPFCVMFCYSSICPHCSTCIR